MPKTKNDKIQLHVEISRCQAKELKVALEELGYGTCSEMIREHLRNIIAQSKNVHDGK